MLRDERRFSDSEQPFLCYCDCVHSRKGCLCRFLILFWSVTRVTFVSDALVICVYFDTCKRDARTLFDLAYGLDTAISDRWRTKNLLLLVSSGLGKLWLKSFSQKVLRANNYFRDTHKSSSAKLRVCVAGSIFTEQWFDVGAMSSSWHFLRIQTDVSANIATR